MYIESNQSQTNLISRSDNGRTSQRKQPNRIFPDQDPTYEYPVIDTVDKQLQQYFKLSISVYKLPLNQPRLLPSAMGIGVIFSGEIRITADQQSSDKEYVDDE